MVVDLIRCQQRGDDLPAILRTPATEHEVSRACYDVTAASFPVSIGAGTRGFDIEARSS